MKTNPLRPMKPTDEIPWAFLHELRECRLLTEEQLARIDGIRGECDLPMLRSLLLELKWLTPYQLHRIENRETRGLVVGQYRILDEVGEGGFGKVYKAVHAIMNRLAAIKFIAPQWADKEEVRSLFLREVVATTRLSHPNIAMAYDANETDGRLWFAMEFVDGPTLERYVNSHGPLPLPLAYAVLHEVAGALHYAHERGMVHRDIKPGNILLPGAARIEDRLAAGTNPTGPLVKVVDFGLARLQPSGSYQPLSICQDGDMVGTPEYIAPEQARNGHLADIRSDLYSLGCTMYFALTGISPFLGGTALETMSMHLEKTEVPLSSLRTDVPPALAAIVHRLMAKKPEHRFQTPSALMEALGFALFAPGPKPSKPVPILPPIPAEPAPTYTPAESFVSQETQAAPLTIPRLADSDVVPGTDLLGAWRQWSGVVATVARGKPARLSDREYKDLYETILNGCRSSASGSTSWWVESMEGVVQPWVSLAALSRLDTRTRGNLLRACAELDHDLSGAPASGSRWGWGLLAVMAAAACVAAVWLARG